MKKSLKYAGFLVGFFVIASFASVFAFYTRGGWTSQGRALPGAYHASGVWGHSTLILNPDHTCTQDVQFMEYSEPEVPPYPQHPVDHEVVSCHWQETMRDGLGKKFTIDPIVGLAPWDNKRLFHSAEYTYGPVMLAGYGIEVDAGANIVYYRMRNKDCVEISFREPCERA